MNEDRKQFDVFLSYSRSDTAFAKWFEAALEGYRPPKALGLRRLNVFRDEHDLVGNTLTPSLRKALLESGTLVIICSPAARASRWVNLEIDDFAASHGNERILPVLLDGEPNEAGDRSAFPEALIRHLPEAFAPDFRNGSAKHRHESLLGVIAFIHKCEKEALALRDHQRTRRRWISVSAIATVIVAAFAGLILWEQVRSTEQSELAAREKAEVVTAAQHEKAIVEDEVIAARLVTAALESPPRETDRALLLVSEALARSTSWNTRQAALDLIERASAVSTIPVPTTPNHVADVPALIKKIGWTADGRFLLAVDDDDAPFAFDTTSRAWVEARGLSSVSGGRSASAHLRSPGIVTTVDPQTSEATDHAVRGLESFDVRRSGDMACGKTISGDIILFMVEPDQITEQARVRLGLSKLVDVAVNPAREGCAVSDDYDVYLVDFASRVFEQPAVDLGGRGVAYIAFSQDAGELRALTTDCTFFRIATPKGAIVDRRPAPTPGLTGTVLAQDGSAYGCSEAGRLHVFTANPWSSVGRITTSGTPAVSPSGKLVADGSEASIRIFDVASGDTVATLAVPGEEYLDKTLNELQFVGEDRLVGRFEAFMQIFSGPSWRALPGGNTSEGAAEGHLAIGLRADRAVIRTGIGIIEKPFASDTVRSLSFDNYVIYDHPAYFSADARLTLSGCHRPDEPSRSFLECLVDVDHRRLLVLPFPAGTIVAVANGGDYVAGLDDKALRITDLGRKGLREAACRLAARPWTRDEWERFLSERTFTPACANPPS